MSIIIKEHKISYVRNTEKNISMSGSQRGVEILDSDLERKEIVSYPFFLHPVQPLSFCFAHNRYLINMESRGSK